jgi:hypothetical protein
MTYSFKYYGNCPSPNCLYKSIIIFFVMRFITFTFQTFPLCISHSIIYTVHISFILCFLFVIYVLDMQIHTFPYRTFVYVLNPVEF